MRIAIVEDEAQVAKRIARLTREILRERVETLDTYSSLDKARLAFSNGNIDLLLLDLNLNGADGFELLETVVGERFHTIVISAYKDRALRAFEFGVLDFVPKPIEVTRLRQALGRLETSPRKEVADATFFAKRLAIRQNGLVELLPIDDVVYISGAADYSEVFLASGKSRLSDKTLGNLELLLSDAFVRIHRSHIVRASEVVKLRVSEGSRYSVELRSGVQLPVSRSRVAELRALLIV